MTTFPKFGFSRNCKLPGTYFVELFAFCGAQHIAKGHINEAVRRNSCEKSRSPSLPPKSASSLSWVEGGLKMPRRRIDFSDGALSWLKRRRHVTTGSGRLKTGLIQFI